MPPGGTALGVGIYSREEAARLIGVTPTRLRRWVGGYTYWYRYHPTPERRPRPPVVTVDLPPEGDTVALSFVELMELRVIARLRKERVSLQEIRRAAALATRALETPHPFASRRVYTDGKRIFAALREDAVRLGRQFELLPRGKQRGDDLIELSRAKITQVIAGGVLEPFLLRADFDDDTGLLRRWWPRGKQTPVLLDPHISFGAPVIEGTRIRTSFVADLAEAQAPEAIAKTYKLRLSQVHAALTFESELKKAA